MKNREVAKFLVFVVFIALLYALPGVPAFADNWKSGDVVGTLTMSVSYSRVEAGSQECGIGLLAADAVRKAAGADIAIVNSGVIENSLNPGPVTWDEILTVFSEDKEISVTKITPHELWQMLEVSVSHITVDTETEMVNREASAFDGFPQISGLLVKYDGSARAGERIYSMSMEDGTPLAPNDTETLITLAAAKYMLEGGYGYPSVEEVNDTGITLAEAFADYIAEGASAPKEGRIVALGVHENRIINLFPKPLLLICLGFLAAVAVVSKIGWNNISFQIYVPKIKKREW
jgi:2',3'-cyclic-nucleotide 2'-phosphodiesterase (5'-nucleotidase family)